eukprot:1499434-Rhodomonas_salina.1
MTQRAAKWENLVFSGGGVKVMAFPAALSVIADAYGDDGPSLRWVKRVAGLLSPIVALQAASLLAQPVRLGSSASQTAVFYVDGAMRAPLLPDCQRIDCSGVAGVSGGSVLAIAVACGCTVEDMLEVSHDFNVGEIADSIQRSSTLQTMRRLFNNWGAFDGGVLAEKVPPLIDTHRVCERALRALFSRRILDSSGFRACRSTCLDTSQLLRPPLDRLTDAADPAGRRADLPLHWPVRRNIPAAVRPHGDPAQDFRHFAAQRGPDR